MVVMGHITGAFGIRGWIKVSPYTEAIDSLLDYSSWWLRRNDDEWHKVEITDGQAAGNALTAKLKECADRNEAAKYKGMQIAIPRDQFPDLSENDEESYYWSDLIGSEVINIQGEKLGKVTGLLETGANDVLVVHDAGSSSKKERLIPYIEPVIKEIDLASSRIIVDWGSDY
ncbi:MAG: ribosome maturation factor RimM [Nitrosomonas sp.]|nr:ribosome maturation factor RimM [Nitrosomonas sp.]